jgi:hypothetical protein
MNQASRNQTVSAKDFGRIGARCLAGRRLSRVESHSQGPANAKYRLDRLRRISFPLHRESSCLIGAVVLS